MSGDRIEVIVDGRTTAFGAGQPRLSSANTPWSGFLLERVEDVAPRQAVSLGHPHTVVALILEGQAAIRYRRGAVQHRMCAGADSICIWPAGGREECFSWIGACEILLARVCEADLGAMHRKGAALAPVMADQVGVRDPCLARLLRAMAAEVEAGCGSGPLYGEALSVALAAYLSGRYRLSPACAETKDAAARRIEPALAHIHDHLGDDLSLAALAMEAGLGTRELCRLFRRALGMTPHRYVLRERIRRAQKLLHNGRLPLPEVAQALGFASQSHFTAAFRRATGTTPGRYQQAG